MHLSHLAVWALYMTGQVLHVLLAANLVLKSKLNAVSSLAGYFALRWIPLLCRFFLTTLAFVLVWNNPSLVNIDHLMPTASTQIAMAGILGWFSDSVFDKFISMVPWLQKELPAVPQE
jgi:hypothetical protein